MSSRESPNSQASDNVSLITKMSNSFASLNCCGGSVDQYEEDERPSLQISGPTNFRREEVKLASLTPEQQLYIREKAASDAKKMWSNLQPLASSPSTTFAERPPKPLVPNCTYEQFTTPRPAPNPDEPSTPDSMSGAPTPVLPEIRVEARRGSMQARLDRVRAHSRKISEVLTSSVAGYGGQGKGYESVQQEEGMGREFEMRKLEVKGRVSGESSEGEVLDGQKL